MRSGPIIALVIIGVTLAALFLSGEGELISGLSGNDMARLGALLAVLVFIIMGSGALRRHPMRDIIGGIIFWVGLCAALVIGYSLYSGEDITTEELMSRIRGQEQRVLANQDSAAVEIRARGNQFIANTRVDGVEIPMLFDTGATTVALSREHARAIGINLEGLNYFIPVQTAGGTTMAAPVTLNEIAIGPIVVRNVRAVVSETDSLIFSLLGMSFLNRIVAYEVRQDRLILRN